MRYEHLTLDLSTAALANLRVILAPHAAVYLRGGVEPSPVAAELLNLFNEVEARLQRHDQDPTVTRKPPAEGPFCSVDCKAFHTAKEEAWDLTA